VQDLLENAKKLLAREGQKKLMFKAPTGSGKTLMVAEFLKHLADDSSGRRPLAFIWAAPRQLHDQSKDKLEQYFENSRALECSFFEDLNDRRIGENEILFFNWESIRQDGNIYIRDNEQDNNLSSILERTREAGREIVLIIDESHFHAQAETSQGLIQMIAPKLTIEVSATHTTSDEDEKTTVDIDDVRGEGMIKKSVALNLGFDNVSERAQVKSALANSTDEIVLREAVAKRIELAGLYEKANVPVNPLLLIQLPDRHGQADEDTALRIERILADQYGITVANGKLAIKLSGRVEHWENIERADGEQEALIFKHSITLGWDCPRAHILALFREWKSIVFSIQTIGRIMRMPEPERGKHYGEKYEELNHAYVYTNIKDIQIAADIAGGYLTTHASHRRKNYKPIYLPSVHSVRHREKTRFKPFFIDIFLREAERYGLEKKLKVKNQQVHPMFIANWRAENIDTLADRRIEATERLAAASEWDLHRMFDYFVRKSLSPQFYPEGRSVDRIKDAIYLFVSQKLKMDYVVRFAEVINIVLSEKNQKHFLAVIEMAKIEYQKTVGQRGSEIAEEPWDPREIRLFGASHKKMSAKRSLMEPFFYDYGWKSEEHFIKFLDGKENIEWWFKNGDRDATFFAVPYGPENNQAPFYVDFVVMMKDGSIGLFDPHSIHLADFASKSDGLQAYIALLKKEGRKVSGGIVANTDPRNYTGQWMLYEGEGKDARKDDWSGWTRLEL